MGAKSAQRDELERKKKSPQRPTERNHTFSAVYHGGMFFFFDNRRASVWKETKAPYGNEDLPAARLPARLRGFPSDQSDRGILGDIT